MTKGEPMTCSIKVEEMLERPVRMTFIQYEAEHATSEQDCRWPPESHEYRFWMEVFNLPKKKPPGLHRRASIPHQRDVEMATKSTVAILS